MPSNDKWRDAWNPDRVYDGGQTITVRAELHQLPLFIRAGSRVELGDLNVEWNESRAIAERKPDLKALDEALKLWFAKTFSGTEPMKTEKVVLQLEEMIHRGDLRPGDRLPPERDLARFLV